MRDVLYNSLRDAHSEPKRIATSKRIGLLLSRNDKDSLVLAIKLLGFNDVNQYLFHLSQIVSAKEQLAKSGIFLDKLPSPILTEATRLASTKLGRKYPVIFARQPLAAKQTAKTLGGGDICWQCHYNNCDECGSQIEPGTIAEDGTFEDGPSYNCRQNAADTRLNSIRQAENTLWAALPGCGMTAYAAGELACGATMVTIVGAPISPGVGAGVFCFVSVTCATYVVVDYQLKIQQAELVYQDKVANCPR